jgi:hypothetical protein
MNFSGRKLYFQKITLGHWGSFSIAIIMGEVMGYKRGISIKIGKSNVAGKCSN